jgi:S1-C subfamily serine protease
MWCEKLGKTTTVANCKKAGGIPRAFGSETTPDPKLQPDPQSTPDFRIIATGTGFAVNKNYVVTAEHVLENCNSVSIKHGHKELDAQTVARDSSNDLGLIRLAEPFPNTAKLRGGKMIRLGEMVANYGYPLFGQLSSSATITQGNINNLSGAGNDSTVIQFDAPTQPGNSGGPILDSSGNVVGVAIQILSKKYADATGHIAQNVNFAVKSNIVENFLQSNNVPFEKAVSTEEVRPGSNHARTFLGRHLAGATLPMMT